MAIRANRRGRGPERGTGMGSPFTVLAYLCAVMAALVICGSIGPGRMWRRSGIQKVYRSYLVLELPVSSEEAARGVLAGEAAEIPAPHEKLMKTRRLSLPEYTQWLSGYPWEGSHLKTRQDGVRYQVYYVPAGEETTRVPIPVGYEYILSGDGRDGFIVTIWEETS